MTSIHRSGLAVAALLLAGSALPAAANARSGVPTNEAIATLAPGDFLWDDSATATGPVRIVVSMIDQRAYVYRGATLVAVSAVSTGAPGHETPTGDFTILQKAVAHKSTLYDDASMPYMQRLTWDGIAIHAGRDPGYAASHGCVRVPLAFAKKLYGATTLGAHVTITDDVIDDAAPSTLAPPDVGADLRAESGAAPSLVPASYTAKPAR